MAILFGDVTVREWDLQVFEDGEVIQKIVILEYEPDALFLQFETALSVELVHRFLSKPILAAPSGIMQPQDVQQSGFAGSGRPHDREKIALLDFKADVSQGKVRTAFEGIDAADIAQLDHQRIPRKGRAIGQRFL